MRGLWHTIIGMTALFASGTAAIAEPGIAAAQGAIGRWATPTRHGIVEIAPCGSSLCGRLVASDAINANPDVRDTKNGTVGLRNRTLKGLLLLSGFHRTATGWDGGTIYNPDDGGLYHATITVSDGQSAPNTINLRGCVIWPLCKSQTWHRVP